MLYWQAFGYHMSSRSYQMIIMMLWGRFCVYKVYTWHMFVGIRCSWYLHPSACCLPLSNTVTKHTLVNILGRFYTVMTLMTSVSLMFTVPFLYFILTTHSVEIIAQYVPQESGSNQVVFMQLDLGSLKSVHIFADNFLKSEPRLDLLINNAGKIVIALNLYLSATNHTVCFHCSFKHLF